MAGIGRMDSAAKSEYDISTMRNLRKEKREALFTP